MYMHHSNIGSSEFELLCPLELVLRWSCAMELKWVTPNIHGYIVRSSTVMHWFWWDNLLCVQRCMFMVPPQVGEMRRNERQEWLHARYFFTCACLSCKTVSQPDLLLFAFRCSKAACDGVVPGPSLLKQLDQRVLRNDSTEVSRFILSWTLNLVQDCRSSTISCKILSRVFVI